ncbi:FliA/WhiG family RNA polymerase sigma factor [Thalassomonas viridans]|uniref:FliA/WhiG family RNA polymerase sigma factor n=1 Tax=Thalassomonas viridans TaxID=137584 RepID=UPI0005E01CA6|nr:FliA/WhiG family RNA polymerase sigma factor [Thalassomonas viridans]
MNQSLAWKENSEDLTLPCQEEEQLLIKYLYLVKRAVSHLRSQVSTLQSYEDLIQIGTMGLLEAIRRYGSEPDDVFEGYAFKRIRGAILDELRRQDWRPRQARQQAHKLNRARRNLLKELGREPSEEELAAHLEVDLKQVQAMEFDNVAEEMHSLDELLQVDSNVLSYDSSTDNSEMKQALAQTLALLDKREQLLLTLYYQYELNMKEIALTLKITESRVCQLHKLAIKHLHTLLAQQL